MITESSSGKFNPKGLPRRESRPGGENNLTIASSAFEHNGYIPEKYTCDGENINPPLQISHVSENAQSLVLIVHDPDAPLHGGWTHWTIWNIDPNVQEILEDSIPDGSVEGMTNFGQPGYGGPCPPEGVHHYNFMLYALDSQIALDSQATKDDLVKVIDAHILQHVVLTGLYKRKNQ